MMNYITRMAGILLAFGFFFGCNNTTTSHFQAAKLNLNQQDYSKALSSINKAIKKNPQNPESYYYKGYILNKMASENNEPSNNEHLYREMRHALMKAKSLFKKSPNVDSNDHKIDNLLTQSWSKEHNLGVKIMKNDSSLTQKDLNNALAYLNNATIIQPDSEITYEVKSDVYYRLGDLPKAVNSMETAVAKSNDHTKEELERLAFLYLENQQYDHAIDTYKEALEDNPGNINLLHGLENAYLANGNHQQAVALIKRLINKDPNNAEYRMAYGTQLFSIGKQYLQKLTSVSKQMMSFAKQNDNYQNDNNYQALKDSANSLDSEAQNYFNSAENQLLKSQSIDSTNINTDYALGILYHDYATAYLNMEKVIPNKKLAELYKGRIQKLYKESLPYLEKVANNQPQTPSYWKILYKVYNYLGFKAKADSAYTNFQKDS
ncbi:MAG TPA: tetratricopeptide repeat protein [Balneolales bacterium]|nr:tetratricopeptide repeat protein [Balneolales bacterium]